jgi:hypothetical protein
VKADGRTTRSRSRAAGAAQVHKVIASPIVQLETISPDGKWAVVEASVQEKDVTRGVVAYPLRGGNPKRVCYNLCVVRWTLDGKFLNIALPGGNHSTSIYRTMVVPLRPGEDFPPLPPKGIKSPKDLAGVPGLKLMDNLIRPG